MSDIPNLPSPAYNLPLTPIIYSKPDEEIPESEKWEDDEYFFVRMNRYIVYNFYNPYFNRFYNNEVQSQRCSDNMIEAWSYYYGRQNNNTFAHEAQIKQGETIQAVYIPDQKIRQLVDHAVGTCIKIIQPIKDSISAKVLSEDAIKGKEELRKKLETKKALSKLITEESGVSFAPAGIEDIDEETDLDEVMDKFKTEEELQFIKLAQSIYYNQHLDEKYEQSALHELVGNVSQFVVDVAHDKSYISFTPNYNAIVDTRATDDYLRDALVSGYIEFLSPAEIFAKWGSEISDDDKDFINNMSQCYYSNWLECYNYYNLGCPNLTWWDNQTGKISVATTYWIGKKDLPHRKKNRKYGNYTYQFIDPVADYHVMDAYGVPLVDDDGKNVTQKGAEKLAETYKKDEGIWMVHTSTLIGNRVCVGKGYHPVQIRPQGEKQKPMLPTVQFCHRLNMGYMRSVVSRLIQYAQERANIKLKIQELRGRDIGKTFVLFASKLGLTDQEIPEIYKDLRTLGFTLINDLGEPGGDDKKGMTADMLDFSLAPSITAYIELYKLEGQEMESLVNIPAIALGTQTSTIGKGVQEATISQSTLGQASLYNGLLNHWKQVLSYALNVEKTLKAGKESLIRTGENEAFLLNISKKLKYEEIGIYLQLDDELNELDKTILRQGYQAYLQNGGDPKAAEALYNVMKLINANSIEEGVEQLGDFVSRNKKEAIQLSQAQTQGETQAQMQLIEAQKTFEARMKEMELLIKSDDTRYVADVNSLTKLVTSVEKSNDQIIQLLLKQQSENAPTTPLQAEIATPAAPAQ